MTKPSILGHMDKCILAQKEKIGLSKKVALLHVCTQSFDVMQTFNFLGLLWLNFGQLYQLK